jgi:hypothetical protein
MSVNVTNYVTGVNTEPPIMPPPMSETLIRCYQNCQFNDNSQSCVDKCNSPLILPVPNYSLAEGPLCWTNSCMGTGPKPNPEWNYLQKTNQCCNRAQ